jgi:hypothetical protein
MYFFCSDYKCDDCVHVDLTLNPERYTGYSGEASRRIWRSIYEENCFRSLNSLFFYPGVPVPLSFH